MDKVVHFEIPFDDFERVAKFYRQIFDWEITSVPDFDYHIVRTVAVDKNQMPVESGAINGGMYQRSDVGAKSPVITIQVESIDNSLIKAKAAGSKIILNKKSVGDMGFSAQISDTEGNIIGLWQTTKH